MSANQAVFAKYYPDKIFYSYFRKEPWIENEGIDYMGGQKFKSSPLTSYTHTFSDLIDGAIQAGLNIADLKEFDYSLEGFDKIEQGKIPLSYILKVQKD